MQIEQKTKDYASLYIYKAEGFGSKLLNVTLSHLNSGSGN